MATVSNLKSVNTTLSTTTVDRHQLLQPWDWVEVFNHDTSTTAWVTDDGATDPVAGAEGAIAVGPGERLTLPARSLASTVPNGSTVFHEIRWLGNGGTVSTNGLPKSLSA